MVNPNNNVMEIDDGPSFASGSGMNGTGAVKSDPDAAAQTASGPEGRVGKLVFFKSGKCKLKIGDIYFDVCSDVNYLLLMISFDVECCCLKTRSRLGQKATSCRTSRRLIRLAGRFIFLET